MSNNSIEKRDMNNSAHITTHPDYIMGRRSGRAHKPTEKFKGFLTHIGSHSLDKRGEKTNRDLSVVSFEEISNSKLEDSLSIVSENHLDKKVLGDMTEEILNQDEVLKSATKDSCNPTDASCVDENDATCEKAKNIKDADSSYKNANFGSLNTKSSEGKRLVHSLIQLDSINDLRYNDSYSEATSEKELQSIVSPLKVSRNLATKRKSWEKDPLGIIEESCRKKKKDIVETINSEADPSLKSRSYLTDISKMTMDECTALPIDDEEEGRPPFSYSKLIVQAIASVPEQQLTLDDIYYYIKQNHSYYQRTTDFEWQTHIRNNLLTPYFMRVENSYVTGKGYLWKMDPNFSKRLLDQAFKVRNDRDITNQNKSNQSSFSSKYQLKEKVRKINKSPKMTTPENCTLSKNSIKEPNNIGNELQIKIRPLNASDITDAFLKAHHIRTQSRERLKFMLSKKNTGRKGHRVRKPSHKLQDFVVSEWNGNTTEVTSKLEKTVLQSQVSSQRSTMNVNKSINHEENVNITELPNVNSTDRPSLMPIHNFRIPAKCMSETRIKALSISPPQTPVKPTICRASACSENDVESSNNENNVEKESNNICESLYDKCGDEYIKAKVKDHSDEKKSNNISYKLNIKSPKIYKLTNEDHINTRKNSVTHKTKRNKLKECYFIPSNSDICFEQKFTSHEVIESDVSNQNRGYQKTKIPRKNILLEENNESNDDIKSINETPESRVQESAASGRRSGRVSKPTEKLLDFMVSKGKINCSAISITEEDNIIANEANNILKDKESQDLPTYSEDEFISPILSTINVKANKKVNVLQASNNEKKSRRKQPPNTIRKITADGSVPRNGFILPCLEDFFVLIYRPHPLVISLLKGSFREAGLGTTASFWATIPQGGHKRCQLPYYLLVLLLIIINFS